MGLGYKCLRREYIMQGVEQSLKRLQIDAIDLYQSHWDDDKTPFEETLEAYSRLLKQGKVKAIGASNLTAQRLAQALAVSKERGYLRYATLQPLYNLYDRDSFEGELQELCVREQLGVITYFSLAAGFLTGKYRKEADFAKSQRGRGMQKYLNPRGLRILAALDEVSKGIRAKPAHVALAWLTHRPGVTAPIASATSLAQLRELIAATRLELDANALRTLDAASTPT
jgi:aryl-alcohol dehydrogenase-like predicted oxidoreductase